MEEVAVKSDKMRQERPVAKVQRNGETLFEEQRLSQKELGGRNGLEFS